MSAGRLFRLLWSVLGSAKWLLPIGGALGAAAMGLGGPAPLDDRVLIAAADLRPGLLALAGATDAARDSGDLLHARIATVEGATAGEHDHAHRLAQQAAESLEALLADAYGYAAGAGTAGAGSTSFSDTANLTGDVTRELVAARDAAADRGTATQFLLVFALSTGLLFGAHDLRAMRRRARRAARFDSATGLLRRGELATGLQRMMQRRRADGGAFAVAIEVETLQDVARTSGLADADSYFGQFVGRVLKAAGGAVHLGRGDGYSLIVCGLLQDGSEPATLADTLLSIAHEPLSRHNRKLDISVSIGYATISGCEGSAEELFQNASLAASQARRSGRNAVQPFVRESEERMRDQLALSTALAQALTNREFEVHYQPVVDGATSMIVSAEALLRWREPSRGRVSPAEFVPLLEESGRISEVGAWVLETACRELARWHRAGHTQMRVAVNVSVRQFEGGQLVDTVRRVIELTGIDPCSLEIEVTESLAATSSEEMVAALTELRMLGVTAALDDFGTGQSSLGRLRELPLRTLKLDRSLVSPIADAPEARAVVTSTVDMAHAMRMQVVAEGVETAEQCSILRDVGCDLMQGWLFSPAVTADAFSQLLLDQSRVAA
jgi:EAL domain-containing protein (putative c-di-GMP-specific phosphodiesterase class I)/GGDEF domain-containing protein